MTSVDFTDRTTGPLRCLMVALALLALAGCGHTEALNTTKQLRAASIAAAATVEVLRERDRILVGEYKKLYLSQKELAEQKVAARVAELEAFGARKKSEVTGLTADAIADIHKKTGDLLAGNGLDNAIGVALKDLRDLTNQYALDARRKLEAENASPDNMTAEKDAALARSRYNAALGEFYYHELNARQYAREKAFEKASAAVAEARSIATEAHGTLDKAVEDGREALEAELTKLTYPALTLEPAKSYAALDAYVDGVKVTAGELERYLNQRKTLPVAFGTSIVAGLKDAITGKATTVLKGLADKLKAKDLLPDGIIDKVVTGAKTLMSDVASTAQTKANSVVSDLVDDGAAAVEKAAGSVRTKAEAAAANLTL